MMDGFYANRQYLDHEFENACWQPDSGQDAETLSANIKRLVDENLDLPMPLLRARAFAYLLANAQIEINPYNIFADKINVGVRYADSRDHDITTDNRFRGVNSKKTAEQDLFAQNLYARFHAEVQQKAIPYEYQRNKLAEQIGIGTAWADYWHTLPDWNDVLQLGFAGLLERAEKMKAAKAAAGELTNEQAIFFDAVIISYRAILQVIRRLYDASLRYDLASYSECLSHILEAPPRTLYEALETVSLFVCLEEIGVERSRSLGLIDRLYAPFYQDDLKMGRITREDAKEMFRYFFNKYNAAKRFAAQPFALGGTYPDGTDASNELTLLILDVYGELGNLNPKIQIRYHAGLADAVLEKVVSLIRQGQSSLAIMNDEAIYRGYEKIGISRDVSVNYVPIGCYEPVIMGQEDAMICACFMNMVKAVEFAVTGGSDLLTGTVFGLVTPSRYDSFEQFLAAFYAHLDSLVEHFIDNIDKQTQLSDQINPSPVLSGSIRSCVARGRDYFAGGMPYSNTTFKCYGIATTVDSLLAVKKLVFDEKRLDLPELHVALKNNWQGYEFLRHLVLRDQNKYGNNLAEPDQLMCEIYDHLAKRIVGRKNARGGVYRLGADSIQISVQQGKRTGATPDGRLSGQPVSKNLCAVSGMEWNGVTAHLQSVLKLDHDSLLGSEPLDFIVHPSAVEGKAGLKAMITLFKTYFANGGITLQGNIIDHETLLAAREDPLKYQNLQVRLCGWNEYFVNLTEVQQLEFIKQTQSR